MIPVYQTLTVANNGSGNCFNACVASIMERPLRAVAQILPRQSDEYWKAWGEWAATQDVTFNLHARGDEVPKGYAIASGYGGRTFPDDHELAGEQISHAVVVFNGELIHDPFTGGKGIDRARHYWTLDPVGQERKEP